MRKKWKLTLRKGSRTGKTINSRITEKIDPQSRIVENINSISGHVGRQSLNDQRVMTKSGIHKALQQLGNLYADDNICSSELDAAGDAVGSINHSEDTLGDHEAFFDSSMESNLWAEDISFHQIDPNYINNHPALCPGIRKELLKWMRQVAFEGHQKRMTYQLSVNYLDRFFSASKNLEINHELQLIACAALILANKLEELDETTILQICEFDRKKKGEFDNDQYDKERDDYILDFVYRKEYEIIKLLDYNLAITTPHCWMLRFFQVTEIKMDRTVSRITHLMMSNCRIKTNGFCRASNALDAALEDYGSLQFRYSSMAASLCYLAYEDFFTVNIKLFKEITRYDLSEIQLVVKFFSNYWLTAPQDPVWGFHSRNYDLITDQNFIEE